MNNFKLCDLEKGIRVFLSAFIIVITLGVSVGLVYVYSTTGINPGGTEEQYAGSEPGEFEIPEKYPKSFEGMLLTTHTHLIAFAVIFLLMGGLFQFNSIISGNWKNILIIEPFVATLTTFGSLWGIRYGYPVFSYVTILSGCMMYLSFFILVLILLYDLIVKKTT